MESLKELVARLEADHGKFFEGGIKAAGTRARVLCSQIKKELDNIRKSIQDTKKEGGPV